MLASVLALAAQTSAPGAGSMPVRTHTGPPLVTSFESEMIAAPPPELGLNPFYKKYADAFGIPIVSSERVPDAALLMARDIVNDMLLGRPDIRRVMVERHSRVLIMAESEGEMDLPERSSWTKPSKEDPRLTPRERGNYDAPNGIGAMTAARYWNNRARGMGGNITSAAEENLMGYPGTKYFGEHILVHEFSHNIMGALRTADPGLYDILDQVYVGHHIPADIYYAKNLKPARRSYPPIRTSLGGSAPISHLTK
jgi:hypothetical protein